MPQVFSAVKAVIKEGDRFLVVKQAVNGQFFWDLPGGRVNFGESPYYALHREVMEETGLKIEIVKPLGLWWFFRSKDGDQVVCNTFLCNPKHKNIDLSKNAAEETISEFKWVTKEEFLSDKYTVGHQSLKGIIAEL